MNDVQTLTADEIWERVLVRWDMDRPDPQAIGNWLRCPVCRESEIIYQSWTHFKRDQDDSTGPHRFPYRIDVIIKCAFCSGLWIHGLVADQEWWDKYSWQEGVDAEPVRKHFRETKEIEVPD